MFSCTVIAEMVKNTLDQHILLYNSYVKNKSYKSHKRRFHHKYLGVRVPAPTTTYDLSRKVSIRTLCCKSLAQLAKQAQVLKTV
jgi:hypothetical protein